MGDFFPRAGVIKYGRFLVNRQQRKPWNAAIGSDGLSSADAGSEERRSETTSLLKIAGLMQIEIIQITHKPEISLTRRGKALFNGVRCRH